jgi:hypothetical protein
MPYYGMKRILDNHGIEAALHLLGELLAHRNHGPYRLVVCGGAALLLANLRTETTKDVDIVAFRDESGTIHGSAGMPPELLVTAEAVARQLNLDLRWLNTGPSSIVNPNLPNLGLPEGFDSRLTERTYGPMLTISYIGRRDQIFFKLYAAVDRGGPSYHLDDLKRLAPQDEEMLAAARWTMIQDPSMAFAETLVEMLRATGYDTIARQL